MGEVLNLRRARKARDRAAKAAAADANRVSHGRTTAQRNAAAKTKEKLYRALDGARLERDVD